MKQRLSPEQRKARAAIRRDLESARGFAAIHADFAKGFADQVARLEQELAATDEPNRAVTHELRG